MAVGAKLNPGGRSQADVERRRERIWKVIRVFCGPPPPSKVCSGYDVVNAIGPIPGRSDIPFHIGVKGEHFAICVERNVEWIAETTGKKFEGRSIAIRADDM